MAELVQHGQRLNKDTCATNASRTMNQHVGCAGVLAFVRTLNLLQQVQKLVGSGRYTL